MNLADRIPTDVSDCATLTLLAADTIDPHFARAAELLFVAPPNGEKTLIYVNDGSACGCQHFSMKLLGCFERERLPFPVVALTKNFEKIGAALIDANIHICPLTAMLGGNDDA